MPSPLLFCRFLLRKGLAEDSLSSIKYAVFGLGDSGYPKYNVSGTSGDGGPQGNDAARARGRGPTFSGDGGSRDGRGGSTIFLDYARSAQAAKRQGGGPSVSPLTLRRNTPPCSGGCQEAIPPTRRPGGRATAAARGGAGTGRRPAPQRIRGRTGPLAAASVGMPQGCAPLAARRGTGMWGRVGGGGTHLSEGCAPLAARCSAGEWRGGEGVMRGEEGDEGGGDVMGSERKPKGTGTRRYNT